MDAIAIALLILVVALGAAMFSRGSLTAWAREEWRLMRQNTWAMTRRPGITGGSVAEPRVAAMDLRMRAYAKRLRREGRHLTNGRRYVPVLTKPAEPPPPRAAKVYPIRKPQR